MNNLNLLYATNPSFRLVVVTFAGSTKQYTYKTILELEEGDTVVVSAPGGMTCVEVVAIKEIHEVEPVSFEYKWIVQKLDTEHYEKMLETDSAVRKQLNQARTSKLVKDMQKELKESIGANAVKQLEKLVRL